MKQTIPFIKEITFDTNIANIISISLEHEEQITEGEINGEFIILGEYKEHNDTTEIQKFKFNLPFTTLIPEDLDASTIKLDIEDFTYDNINENTIKINIDYKIEGSIKEIPYREEDLKLENIFNREEPPIIEEPQKETTNNNEIIPTIDKDYIIYNIHIVNENETLEDIIKKYDTTIDNIKEYNDITNINIGDKIIIPKYNE